MMYKLIALSVVFGLVVAEPIARTSTDDVALVKPDATSLILDVITALIGYKASALTLAVSVIEWLVSNFLIILFGATTTLGFCKMTDKCHLLYKTYEEYVPIEPLRNLVTPEHLETAEKFFVSAVEKYADDRMARKL